MNQAGRLTSPRFLLPTPYSPLPTPYFNIIFAIVCSCMLLVPS